MKEIYLSDVKNDPKGRCVDCGEFIPDNPDPKQCHCEQKKGYITQNALRKLACKEYNEIIRPEYTNYLLSEGYTFKEILDAIKKVRLRHPNEDYSSSSGQITIEVLTRDLLERDNPKHTRDCDEC